MSRATKLQRVLPADVFDTLEFSALVYGGIGLGKFFEYADDGESVEAPVCVFGHGFCADLDPEIPTRQNDLTEALDMAGITVTDNDNAVALSDGRISFRQWCRRLNVVRGVA